MIFLLWLACSTTDPVGKRSEPTPEPPSEVLPEVSESELGEVIIEPSEALPRRQLKRMTVAQARDSMMQISGHIPWGDEDESNWDVYADTLGVADYQLRVESDRSASVMFQKFLDDAATATCAGWVTATSSSFFSIDDPTSIQRADVRANIVGLRWQVQGKAKDDSALIIDDYEQLFFTAHERAASVEIAWTTVCVAMFTHPDFFMY